MMQRFRFSHPNVESDRTYFKLLWNNRELWFYSKDEGSNFNNNIENTDYFNSFKYKAELLGNIVAQLAPNDANEILKIGTISVPLNYLSNLW